MKITRSAFLRNTALGLCAAGILAACGGGTTESADTGTAGDGSGDVWTVGSEAGFPPFEFVGDDGELDGFDIDLFKAIGEKSGKTIEFENLPFDSLIPALQGGTIDAAISGMTITEEREETVDFSDPYFNAGLAIAVQESTTDIKTLKDLEGKRIAVQIGTTGADTANEVPDAEVTTFENAPLALQELANGNVDAVINDAPATLDAISTGNLPNITVVGELLTEESYGIAMPDGSENVEIVNTALAEIKADGTYAELYRKWFGAEPPTE
ncbi:MAG: basic amino acid ABC transporter substrate-binding protein [Cyanobacteria bacterium J06588_5]